MITSLNNKNKTEITFSYDSGIPYKEEIRPEYEYGDWEEKPNFALIKVNFNDKEFIYLKNKEEIKFINIHFIKKNIWIDLEDCYMVIKRNEYLEKKINDSNFVMAFLINNKLINIWGNYN